MTITLRCTGGQSAGEIVTVDAELVLGREEPDPGRLFGDPRLSRRHARVFLDEAGRALVEDLGSTNGTFVNGERVSDVRALLSGDELRVGQTTLEVEIPTTFAATQVDTPAPAARPTVPDAPPAPARLRVVAGACEGTEIPLSDELLIGRSYDEPGALGGDRLLSRRHARIARAADGVFYVKDMGSTNGTRLNGAPLRRAHPLKDGDLIEAGSSKLEALGMPPGQLSPPSRSQFVPQGAASARLSSRRGLLIGMFVVIFIAAGMLSTGAVFVAKPLVSQACPRGFVCHGPPTAPPLRALRTFTGSLGWRVEYDPQFASLAGATPSGNELILEENAAIDRIIGLRPGAKAIGIVIRAYPTSRTSAQAAMSSLAGALDHVLVGTAPAPASDQMFSQPVVGFHSAFGEVLEGNARTPQGPGGLFKVAVTAASSGGVTISAGIVYQVRAGATQGSNPDAFFDGFGDQILETIRFPSDGPG